LLRNDTSIIGWKATRKTSILFQDDGCFEGKMWTGPGGQDDWGRKKNGTVTRDGWHEPKFGSVR